MTLDDRQTKKIDSWMESGILKKPPHPIDDLHLDAIDPAWKDKKLWLPAAIAAYRYAAEKRDARSLPVSVVLVMSLLSSTDPLGVNFRDKPSLELELDASPPALYLIRDTEFQDFYGPSRRGELCEDYIVKNLPSDIFGNAIPARSCQLLEFRQRGVIEYSRTVHLIG